MNELEMFAKLVKSGVDPKIAKTLAKSLTATEHNEDETYAQLVMGGVDLASAETLAKSLTSETGAAPGEVDPAEQFDAEALIKALDAASEGQPLVKGKPSKPGKTSLKDELFKGMDGDDEEGDEEDDYDEEDDGEELNKSLLFGSDDDLDPFNLDRVLEKIQKGADRMLREARVENQALTKSLAAQQDVIKAQSDALKAVLTEVGALRKSIDDWGDAPLSPRSVAHNVVPLLHPGDGIGEPSGEALFKSLTAAVGKEIRDPSTPHGRKRALGLALQYVEEGVMTPARAAQEYGITLG